MTHSWPSQQAPGGGGTERFLYSDSKEKKRPTSQHRHVREDASVRMPRMAPQKSMLADDLKLSSDEDEGNKGPQQTTSWTENHNLAGQRAYTHSGRVRHSTSGSSASDSSSESESSGRCSRSPSPGEQPRSGSPCQPPTLAPGRQDPSVTHWQLDKWFEKVRKNRPSVDRELRGGPSSSAAFRSSPGLSPGRYWERDPSLGSRQDYSPRYSPVPSPQFDYRQSPYSSPGYSTCPSPGNSPGNSPVPSVCPSPGASPQGNRSPSPLPLHPPKSPSLAPASASPRLTSCHRGPAHRETPRPPARPTLASGPACRPKARPCPDHRAQRINEPRPKDSRPPAFPKHHAKHSSAHSETPHRPKGPSRTRSSPAPNSSPRHRTGYSSGPSPKAKSGHPSSAAPSTQRSHTHADAKSKFGLNAKPKHSSTPKPKHAAPGETSSRPAHGPDPDAADRPLSKPASRRTPSPKPKGKTREVPAPVLGPFQKEPKARERGQAQGAAPVRVAEAQRRGRLAEEQLVNQRRVRSSAGEDEEEERTRKKRKKGHHVEWRAVQPKQRPHTNSQHHPRERGRPEWAEPRERKRRRSCEESSSHPGAVGSNPSPPLSPPNPALAVTRRSSSSSSSSSSSPSSSSSESSSESDSEPGPPPNVAKVPADSTSSRRPISKRRPPAPSGPAESGACAAHHAGPDDPSPAKGQQHRGKHRLYTLVPFGRTEQSSKVSHRGLRDLVVKIDLALLTRVPSTSEVPQRRLSSSSSTSSSSKTKEKTPMRNQYHREPAEARAKRKAENGEAPRDSKRSLLHADKASSGSHADGSENKESHGNDPQNGHGEDYFYTKRPVSPLSPPSAVKTQNSDQQQAQRDREPTVKKTQVQRSQPKTESEFAGMSGNTQPPSGSWVPPANQPATSRGTVPCTDVSHHVEYYMHEAKRLKHRADAMVDKLGKAVNYVDAALSFMECGKAMEESPLEAKSPYAMYAETVDLIRYAMRLKSHTGPAARQEDKQLAVLCFRCLALLYWQMFRLKKEHALKYSKALLDYFKSSPKVPHTQASWNDSTKGNVLPSCASPVGLTGPPSGCCSASPFISIPQRIHQMAANHLNITNSVLYSYEYWEVADTLAKENKEFFNYLNTLTGPLTLHSSMAHIVQYTRQGLQWIRISAHLS
ncbi:AF4/FMR2 family member 3 isoform X2 [Electrophorus electricus]|uniref:AF4/FMR2 family member 3 isoform X2 n=1 Tax=Electrophorus electricus TaxID=8005 RepID=UPI0015D002C6|nr:AF4/FMR2 family member 3 isoform X2 [Electrophorus electricus]XP_035378689.1 AF4/FMR2 family member 3 isoform X2 [Electrophorus electricus]